MRRKHKDLSEGDYERKKALKKSKKKKKENMHKKKKVEQSPSTSDGETVVHPVECKVKEPVKLNEPVKQEDNNPKKVVGAMTKEQYEKERCKLKRVYDPETGRNRLVRGDGEIVEEIVSKKRQREINKTATRQDGMFYAETSRCIAMNK